MNHKATSKEEILAASLALASGAGFGAINIRSVAQKCGVSVGCVYRYFPSKAELVSAAVGKIWEGVFHMTEGCEAPRDFRECVRWIFSCIRSGCSEYPSFFRRHASAFAAAEKDEGRRVMDEYLAHIRGALLLALRNDPAVRRGVFGGGFSEEAFAAFVFDNLMSLGLRGAEDCDFLVALIDRLLY